MPTTRKQLIANRKNAQNSTGPRTPDGKHTTSKNATKHGLYSRDTVINSVNLKESQDEYDEFLHSLVEELAPQGALQFQLVQDITNCLWRQRRAIHAETAQLNQELNSRANLLKSTILPYERSKNPNDTPQDPEDISARLAAYSIPTGSFSLDLLRYEMRNDLRVMRALKILKQLQSRETDDHTENRDQGANQNKEIEPNSPQSDTPWDFEGIEPLDLEH
ncbi:MAG: hypothetical protein IH914_04580 [candidate division Zixibacteria bacterium]|nr:hypothetical protein [candidate division Zixibacteria bacterium]